MQTALRQVVQEWLRSVVNWACAQWCVQRRMAVQRVNDVQQLCAGIECTILGATVPHKPVVHVTLRNRSAYEEIHVFCVVPRYQAVRMLLDG